MQGALRRVQGVGCGMRSVGCRGQGGRVTPRPTWCPIEEASVAVRRHRGCHHLPSLSLLPSNHQSVVHRQIQPTSVPSQHQPHITRPACHAHHNHQAETYSPTLCQAVVHQRISAKYSMKYRVRTGIREKAHSSQRTIRNIQGTIRNIYWLKKRTIRNGHGETRAEQENDLRRHML